MKQGTSVHHLLKAGLLLVVLLAFMLPAALFAAENEQVLVALHPFSAHYRAGDGAQAFTVLFYNVMAERFPEGYRVYRIDPNYHLADDMPTGGYPPFICPPPSITGGAHYAISAEVDEDRSSPGTWRLRVYLWDVEKNTLLVSDEMNAFDRASCEAAMPYFLDWILSWRFTDKDKSEENWYYQETAAGRYQPDNQPEKWLFLGIRTGGGSASWFYDANNTRSIQNSSAIMLTSVNTAFHISVHLLRFLDIQTELNAACDFGRLDAGSGSSKKQDPLLSWSMSVPLLIKLNLQSGPFKAGIFAGPNVYIALPAKNTETPDGRSLAYTPSPLGITFGAAIFWRVGPGSIFTDIRSEYDGRWFDNTPNVVFFRNVIRISAGYEFGMITKKQKQSKTPRGK